MLNLDRKSIKGANRLGVAWARCLLSIRESLGSILSTFLFLRTGKLWIPLELEYCSLASAEMPSRCFYIPGKTIQMRRWGKGDKQEL